MPFMDDGKRNYKAEANWEKTQKPERAKQRAMRNAARRLAEKKGLVKKGDNKHVDHRVPLSKGGSNEGNLRVVSAKANLARVRRNKDGSLK